MSREPSPTDRETVTLRDLERVESDIRDVWTELEAEKKERSGLSETVAAIKATVENNSLWVKIGAPVILSVVYFLIQLFFSFKGGH